MFFNDEWRKISFMAVSLIIYFVINSYFYPETNENGVTNSNLSQEKREERMKNIEKGKMFFYDRHLGTNGKSCAYCHEGDKSFYARIKYYPIYDKESRKFIQLKPVIMNCVRAALKGDKMKEEDFRLYLLEVFLKYESKIMNQN